MDGGRKMLQNCSKLPPDRRQNAGQTRPAKHSCNCAYLSLLRKKSTNWGDELSLRDLDCRETTCRCMFTATSKTTRTASAAPPRPVVDNKRTATVGNHSLHVWTTTRKAARTARTAQQGRRSLCPATAESLWYDNSPDHGKASALRRGCEQPC